MLMGRARGLVLPGCHGRVDGVVAGVWRSVAVSGSRGENVMALLEGGRERAGRGPFCPRPGKREGISFLILA